MPEETCPTLPAPRLRAFIDTKLGAILMRRDDWETLLASGGRVVEIDLSATPLGAVAADASVAGSFAQRVASDKSRILVFRDDPKDSPLTVNLDRYIVYEDFRAKDDYANIVESADTDDDQAMRDFLSDWVVIVPERRTRGHHLAEIPGIYKARLLQAG